VASAILEKDPEPICMLQPLTPQMLERAIRRCLAKEPEDRWQTARDLELELKWIAEGGSQIRLAPPGAAKGIHALGRGPILLGIACLLLVGLVPGSLSGI